MPEIDYCHFEFNEDKNTTEIIFYYNENNEGSDKKFWGNSDRKLKVKDFIFPIEFSSDWMYSEYYRNKTNDSKAHLLNPFNFNYAVLKFSYDRIIEYNNCYLKLIKGKKLE